MSTKIFINGEATVAQWPLDRGLQYGDGLFETMRVRAGRVCFLSQHQARLRAGKAALGFTFDEDAVWRDTQRLATQTSEGLLKVLVTRGQARARGYGLRGDESEQVIHYLYPPSAAATPGEAVRVEALTSLCSENPALAGLKTLNRLDQVLAQRELKSPAGQRHHDQCIRQDRRALDNALAGSMRHPRSHPGHCNSRAGRTGNSLSRN
jgi:4-amino-4-deoxychorismate lyase